MVRDCSVFSYDCDGFYDMKLEESGGILIPFCPNSPDAQSLILLLDRIQALVMRMEESQEGNKSMPSANVRRRKENPTLSLCQSIVESTTILWTIQVHRYRTKGWRAGARGDTS